MKSDVSNINPSYFEFVYKYLQRFMPMTKDEMMGLMEYCEFREFNKKTIIVEEGEIENYLSMVVKGLVRKYVRVKKNDVTLQLATEGHVIQAEISYLTRKPSPVVIETLEPTILISISYENMEKALENLPQGEKLGRLILTGMYVKKDEKRYNQLSLSTSERFLRYLNNNPHMLQRVSQKHLASYLNIKPETFSRLKHLIKQRH